LENPRRPPIGIDDANVNLALLKSFAVDLLDEFENDFVGDAFSVLLIRNEDR
jgi:hypothetical protein